MTARKSLISRWWISEFSFQIIALGFLLLFLMASNSNAADSIKYKPFEHFRDCDICSEMVVLPAGKYMMGATKEELDDDNFSKVMYMDETPRHQVDVNSFAIAKYDVTRQQFSAFAKETGFQGKGCMVFDGKKWFFDKSADWRNPGFTQTEQDPVVCVSWNDAQKFIAWINSKVSSKKPHKYRLPTEIEWEYAARAGTVTPMYWGSDRAKQCEFENTRDLSKKRTSPIGPYVNCDSGYANTSPVGSFRPNPWGLFDMLGNVYQWVSDCSSIGYASPPPESPEVLAISCSSRRMRGASWTSSPLAARAANRVGDKIDARNNSFGFRLVATLID